jgi:magnesium transporter
MEFLGKAAKTAFCKIASFEGILQFTGPREIRYFYRVNPETTGSAFRLKIRRHKKTPPGASPGSFDVDTNANKPQISITSFNTEVHREQPLKTVADILNQINSFPELTHWVEIRGLGDRALLESLSEVFSIHRLEMEDVINTYQRPKLEEQPQHLFVISRLMNKRNNILVNDQSSMFVMNNVVITMQDVYEDSFFHVRARIRSAKTNIRSGGAGYLAYAILDSAVDAYFPLLEQLGDQLDELEDGLLTKVNSGYVHRIQSVKRELILLRRTAFAERDKVNDLLRTDSVFIPASTKVYLRDTYDHTIQVMELVESYKEITASLMDIYLSSISNRLNQTMKVLAIISTIFIPLTFIVGVYGMNFSNVDPVTGKILPLNMPELYHPYGYAGVMIFMFIVVAVQVYIFWKKGWLGRSE